MKKPLTLLFPLSAFLLLGFATTGALAQESGSFFAGEERTLSGLIRWKKALGVIPRFPLSRDADKNPCSPFYIAALDPRNHYKVVSVTKTLTWAAGDAEYNVCKYKMTVPANTPLSIRAGMGFTNSLPKLDEDPYYLRDPWVGGSEAQPPMGNERSFRPWNRDVTLGKIGMYLRFEMIYDRLHERFQLPGTKFPF